MNRQVVIIPTYNEEENILNLYKKIKQNIKTDILFVDDNSTDKTQKIIKTLKLKSKNINYIFRPAKLGIGSAHKDGLKWAYKRKYKIIITMDGDGTHDPKYLKNMIKKLDIYDLVISNRFLNKNSLKDWPFYRIVLTTIRHYLLLFFLNLKFDASGGLRCINSKKIKLKDLLSKSNDYCYFWENLYFLNKKKYNIGDIPVHLPYRKQGSSKMKISDIRNALIYLFIFFINNKLRNK